jgi:hypothetical protein
MANETEDRNHCVDCGAEAPQTNTDYTLISTRYGWRLMPRVQADGSRVLEWRCKTCWAKHRERVGKAG